MRWVFLLLVAGCLREPQVEDEFEDADIGASDTDDRFDEDGENTVVSIRVPRTVIYIEDMMSELGGEDADDQQIAMKVASMLEETSVQVILSPTTEAPEAYDRTTELAAVFRTSFGIDAAPVRMDPEWMLPSGWSSTTVPSADGLTSFTIAWIH